MQNKTLMLKLIAVILVLILSLSNFLVLVSYAAEISSESTFDLFSQDSRTNNKNIEFDSYFKQNGNKTYSAILDIEDANKIYLNLKLSNNGYLKTGTIDFEEESFNIKNQEEEASTIQNIDYDKNEIRLNQINRGTEVELEIPIEIAKNEIYKIQNLNSNNRVLFRGIYITEKGKEIEIEKEIFLGLQWDADVEGIVEQNISKHIRDVDGKTVIEVSLNSSLDKNIMPIKETSIEFEVPEMEGKLPLYVNVIANSLFSTNGALDGLSFGENNFEYIQEEKKIRINVQNLANENGEVSWKNGQDEYKVILVYDNLTLGEKNIVLNTKASFDVYGKANQLEKDINSEFILNENIGDINEINSYTSEIYKSFMYANSEYETEYKLDWNLNIGYADLSDKIVISDVKESFINNNQEEIDINRNTYYKQTIISKKNFEKIFGQDGYIRIFNEANEEMITITLEITEDENIVINYQNLDLSKIRIETSKPKTEGTLKIQHVKAIKPQTSFEKNVIKTFSLIENEINLNTIYNKIIEINSNEEQEVEENIEKIEEIEIVNVNAINSINLLEPETKVEISANKESLVTGSVNEDIEIYVSLINNEEKYSLFTNPMIDISLPIEIDYLKVKDVKLIFEEELNIQNTELIEDENGIKHIIITLNGTQTKYNIGNIITGASLIIVTDMSLRDMDESKMSEMQLFCTNGSVIVSDKTEINLVKIEIPEVEEEQIPEEENPESDNEENPDIEVEEMPETEGELEENEKEDVEQEEKEPIERKETHLNVDVNIKSDKENMELKWGEIVTYSITVKNYGTSLKNSNLIVDLPEGLSYMAEEEAFEPIFYEKKEEVKTINWNLEEVLTGREVTKEFKAIVNKDVSSINVNAKIIDNTSGKFAISNNVVNNCKQANVSVQLATRTYSMEIAEEDVFEYEIKIKEILGSKLNNVKVQLEIPNGINYVRGYIVENNEFLDENVKIDNRTVSISIPELLEYEEKYIVIELNANNIKEISDKEIVAKARVNADGIEECVSNEVKNALSKPILEVKHYTNLENNEVNTGNIITHYIEVKNVGTGTAEDLEIVDTYSNGIDYVGTSYLQNNNVKELSNYAGNKSRIMTSLKENETVIMSVTTKTLGSNNIENFVTVSAKGLETITTEKTIYNLTENKDNLGNSSSTNNNQNNNEETNKSNLSGYVWLDNNKNGINETDESKIGNIETWLINKETNYQINANTSSNGKYKFENIENGNYMLVFVYDTAKYSLTKSFVEYINEDLISKGVRAEARINNETKLVAVIENIIVQNGDISNLNIGLVENEIFDLSLNKVVDNIIVKTNKGTSSYNANKKFAKVEIHSKEIEGAEVKITYRFDIKNEGDIQGFAKKIVENMPEELIINLDINPGWKMDEKGRLYNDSLSNTMIGSGETKSIYLILEKTMTEDSTGIINNIAEIAESHNAMKIKDNDSIVGNNNQSEDDISSADVYIGIKTGRTILYISLALSMFIVLSTGIYLINKKVLQY